jgi:hypothetical protein
MKIFLSILLLQITFNAYTQITFEKIYFPINIGYGSTVLSDTDGYILGGTINYCQPILIKTNLQGDTVWTRTYNYADNTGDNVTDFVKTNDNGYSFIYNKYNTGTNYNPNIDKTNNLGIQIWSKSIKRQNQDIGYRLLQTSDNGFLIVGRTNSLPGITGPFPYDAYIIKTNTNGDSSWTRNFGKTNNNDYAYDLIETSDTNYVISGYMEGNGIQIYLIKMKPNGDTIWTKSIGDHIGNYGFGMKETLDKNYIITGQKFVGWSESSNVYLIKTDTSGNVLWEKIYDFNLFDYGERVLVLDNGFLIAGKTQDINYTNKILLIRTNSLGDTLWTKIIEGNSIMVNSCKSIAKCSDDGFIITGWSNSGQLFLIKTDSLGCVKPYIQSITGEQHVSLNDIITYHNNSIRGSWYNWFSSSGNIVSGQGLDNVNIYWNQTGIDTLYSIAYNECGSDTVSYIINIDSCVAPLISSIYGNLTPTIGSISDYYVNKIEGKTPVDYTWSVTLGNIISGQGTNLITIEWENLGMGYIGVVAVNECGNDTTFHDIQIVIDNDKEISNSSILDISIFPVPTKNILYINLPFVYDNFKVEIYDIYGKNKYFKSMLSGLNEVNLSNQPNGMYFLKVITNNNILTNKIILSK